MSVRNKFMWFLGRDRKSFGLDGLDLKVLEFLPRTKGFFIECGANDGVTQSNTRYLEKYLGWRGLLIEPLPQLAEKCRQNRRRSITVQCALVPNDYPDSTIEIRNCNLMSVVRGGMKSEEEEEEHLEAGRRVQAIDTTPSLEVPARTLSSILDEHGITKIDFFSLDVEGYEAPALRGLDLDRHAPLWMLIEARYKADVDLCLRGRYEEVAQLSHHDVLYRRLA